MMGEQVLLLQTAVAHVPAFANKADAAFHLQHTTRVNQTLSHLITTYELVYRNEYEKTTAAEVLTVNQVQASSTAPPDNPALQAIMASARSVIRDTEITPTMLDRLATEITKTVARCLRPPSDDAPTRGRGRQRPPQSQDANKNNGGSAPMEKIPSGCCPLHPRAVKRHSWEECYLNTDRVK